MASGGGCEIVRDEPKDFLLRPARATLITRVLELINQAMIRQMTFHKILPGAVIDVDMANVHSATAKCGCSSRILLVGWH
jgi:hypothetical protein